MEPPSSRFPKPRVSIVNESGRRVPSLALKRAVAGVLAAHGHPRGEACLLIASDARIRDLNRTYRGLDEPTDVLSFGCEPEEAGPPSWQLGDIAIALGYAERQAAARGVSLDQELGYLAIHGALHLVGFDDEKAEDRDRMVAEMNRAAVAAGFEPDEDWASLLHEPEAQWA